MQDLNQLKNLEVILDGIRWVILRALTLNGPMTNIQLSKLRPQNRRGEVLSYHVNPRGQSGRKVFNLRSYQPVQKCLQHWEGKLWKRVLTGINDSNLWIPLEDRRRHLKDHENLQRLNNLAHELAVTDVYVALHPYRMVDSPKTPVLTEWSREPIGSEYNQVFYDASLQLFKHRCYLEVERGNHPVVPEGSKVSKEYWGKSLNHKLERYASFFGGLKIKPLLLITVEDYSTGMYDDDGTERLLESVIALVCRYPSLAPYTLVARQRDVVGNKDHTEGELHNDELGYPLGDSWTSPELDAVTSIEATLTRLLTSK